MKDTIGNKKVAKKRRKRRVFDGVNPSLTTGCSMHAECSSQSGLLLAIGVHRGTWLPGESTSTFAACCMRVRESRVHTLIPGLYARPRCEILSDSVARSVNVLHCVIRHGPREITCPVAMATT